MLRRRVMALEKRFGGIGGPITKPLRIVYQFEGDPEPEQSPDENLIVVQVVNTQGDNLESKFEDERVFRFDFGGGEGHTGGVHEKTNKAAEHSQPTEREKTTK